MKTIRALYVAFVFSYACNSSEGELFTQSRSAALCSAISTVTLPGTGRLVDVAGSRTQAAISYSVNTTAFVALANTDGAIEGTPLTLGGPDEFGLPVLAGAGSGFDVAYSNFPRLGRWTIQRATIEPANSAKPVGEATSATTSPLECIGPRLARFDNRLYVGYRNEQSVALSVVGSDGTIESEVRLAGALPHPWIRRVLASAAGVAVLVDREGQIEVQWFDLLGGWTASGPRISADLVDVVASVEGVWLFWASQGQISAGFVAHGGAATTATVSIKASSALVLRLSAFTIGQDTAVTWVEQEAGAARLMVAWLRAGMLGVPQEVTPLSSGALPAGDVEGTRPRVSEVGGQGVLVWMASTGALPNVLASARLCPP